MQRVIDRFDGEYAFLSNFHPVPGGIEMDEKVYSTVEHAYQASKTLSPAEREIIRKIGSPGQAKKMGRRLTIRPDWESTLNDFPVKMTIMRSLLQKKFAVPELRERLLATEDAILIEGNWWGDTYWGVCRGEGANWLGSLLMEVREELKEENNGI